MDQSWPLQSFGDLPLFRWEDVNQNAPTSARNYPPIQDRAASDITSRLSTRSYPPPESYISETPQNQESCLPSDAVPADHSHHQKTAKSSRFKSTPRRSVKFQGLQTKTGASSIQEPGKPRETVMKSPNDGPDERRRTQLRLAQRAYRTRQQATIKDLGNRISHLETILESMSSTVLSFSEQLVDSGVLESYSGLTVSLRDTMKTFLSLASEASPDSRVRIPDEPSQTEEQEDSSLSSHLATTTRSLPSTSLPAFVDHDRPHFTGSGIPPTVSSSANSFIGLSEFIERLNMEALYQSYLALSNQAIGLEQLQRPFGLILSMLDRETVASYAKAELDAILNRKSLEGWERVPLFSLGGAGTHYLGPSSLQAQSEGLPSYSHRRWDIVEDPLALVASDLQEDLEGDWFDLHDLEEFLRDKELLLLLPTDNPTKGSSTQTIIDVAPLISRGVCLGRTPGFQRGDDVSLTATGRDGAFAEYIVVKGDLQMKILDNMSFQEAAALGADIQTIGQSFYQILGLDLSTQPFKDATSTPILIYGGSSATGTLAIQFVKLSGYTVLTTCSPHNLDLVRSLGANAVFDYKDSSSAAEIRD
ncbi:uncharacterized protein KD926_002652 [Aspergillus affinis]|uniref:uncharacterized protein n=1 Tax=Aspergillus affinis TaxID=1070780 RepID=UPI0022FE5522|nr:uncharacterized protein KD926_002652 [Aspergillus affinis]KAI9035898.1 hypothetical protein KD926_002652 [Aspergillus affinis]